jgi:hypothetical protein
MSLAELITLNGTLLETELVPTPLKKVYPIAPQSAPQASVLPAAYSRPGSGEVDYTPSQRIINHTIEVVVLVARTESQPEDYSTAMPLLEPMVAVYESSMSFGTAYYYGARITGYEIGPVTYLDANYLGLILQLAIKEKRAVSMSV